MVVSKEEDFVSVYDFIKEINTSLSSHRARVKGEVTSLSLQYSTAVYFSMKDKEGNALLNCVIWKSTYNSNGIDLKVGDEVIVTGTPEVYAPQGRFSLKAQTIEYAGEGALKKSYEELKEKILKEGLLDPSKKRPLPKYPKKIGVITSKAGVVIQDFTSNLGRYGFDVTVVDSRVEGKDAIHDLLRSISTMAKQDIEVLVIMRGGGSWESLQPFNTESIVRAVANFKCPVLTGIGHDTDVTLAQMVADVGVSTPTAVAEALNESWDKLISAFDTSRTKLVGIFQRNILHTSRSINTQTHRIKSFFSLLERKISRANMAFHKSVSTLKSSIKNKSVYIQEISRKLISSQRGSLRQALESISRLEKYIKVSDPKRNLELGYSLSYSNNKLIRSKKDIKPGDTVKVQVSDGEFTSEVKKV